MATRNLIRELCLECGLCCSGVLFRDVELQPGDDVKPLAAAGMAMNRRKSPATIPQPCTALGSDLRCCVYGDRPNRCREFECSLFKAVARNELPVTAALKVIRSTRVQAGLVQNLLRRAGENDEASPLARRFKRVQRRCESGDLSEEAIDAYGQLTLAVHALNVLLSTRFYPG